MKLSASCTVVAMTGILIGIGLVATAVAEETPSEAAIQKAEAKYEAAYIAAELSVCAKRKGTYKSRKNNFGKARRLLDCNSWPTLPQRKVRRFPTTPPAAIRLE